MAHALLTMSLVYKEVNLGHPTLCFLLVTLKKPSSIFSFSNICSSLKMISCRPQGVQSRLGACTTANGISGDRALQSALARYDSWPRTESHSLPAGERTQKWREWMLSLLILFGEYSFFFLKKW